MIKYFVIIFVFCFFLNGQVKYNNVASPVLKKKTRVIPLEKIYSIENNPDLFTLKDPYDFKINKDNSLFVIDWQKSLYRFSSTGKYICDLLKKGEGPGELKFLISYFIKNNTVIQFCHYPNKIVEKNLNGKLINEFRIPDKGVLAFIGLANGRFFFSKGDQKIKYNLSDKYKDTYIKNYFYRWKYGDKKIWRSKIYYTEIRRIKKTPGGGSLMTSSPFHALTMSNLKNDSLYFVNSFEYRIKKIRIPDLTLEYEFGRPYTKVKYFHSKQYMEWMKKKKKHIKKPEKKYFKAVMKLINHGKEVWVITSTYVKGKGVLVDVFSNKGVYTDKFYLPIPGFNSPHNKRFNIIDDKLIVLEKDENDEHIISVYRIK